MRVSRPSTWENSPASIAGEPCQNRGHAPSDGRCSAGAERPGDGGVGEFGEGSVENHRPSFSAMANPVEQPHPEQTTMPPAPVGPTPAKTFLASAAGAFLGRTAGDLASRAIAKLLPWLAG